MAVASAAAWTHDTSRAQANDLVEERKTLTSPKHQASDMRFSQEEARAKKTRCTDKLVRLLQSVGFRGENLREAWSIAMRESGGDPTLGPGHPAYNGEDVGLFQFNEPTFGTRPWWNQTKLLTARYNAQVAFEQSHGGKTWWLWGLDGRGRLDAGAYTAVWSPEEIQDWILEPYQRYYDRYPCTTH